MNAEIVALRVKLYNVERDLEDSKADYVKLAHLVCDLWHSSAAAYIPPGLQKRVRDVSHAQLAEEQRFLHGAAAGAVEVERLQRLMQKIMARCADLLDEDQFNELDAMTRATDPTPAAAGWPHGYFRHTDECARCGSYESRHGANGECPDDNGDLPAPKGEHHD